MDHFPDGRIAREAQFHNERFSGESRAAQSKYYFAIGDGAERFRNRVEELAKGADVLEYGCAKGDNTLRLAKVAKSITGIDISDVAIAKAEAGARVNNITNVSFSVMNAESMTFSDGSFDLIFGSGIIHHLDIERSMREIRRVLRPGGIAIFWEPLGHNPVFTLYRALTPKARTEDEHPLLCKDFADIQKFYSRVELQRYGLLTLLAVPFRHGRHGMFLRNSFSAIDRVIFALPSVRWWCWYVSMELHA